ncbi:MAG: DUF1016 family protein [Actinomycetaceae bacterium]|nr:DUF1016 family protein [Actinomycetaceae bacterium]
MTLVQRNWLIGMRIVEEELAGDTRSELYGRKVVPMLAKELTREYGKGFTRTSLYQYAQFYRMFPEIVHSASGQSSIRLTWTHYRELLKVEDGSAREWYEQESVREAWTAKTLRRNIASQYYHRLLKSQVKQPVIDEMRELTSHLQSERLEFVKNPVVAEFLGIPDEDLASLRESKLESAIITNLKKFLIELGKGYAYVGRQYRIKGMESDYFVDLVFYNYELRCFVLIDLKTTEITHQDVGQMDMYVRMFDEVRLEQGHNPTLGIVLCSQTNADVARYSLLNGSDQLFAAKYKRCLPSEDELRAEIEAQKEIFYQQRSQENKS